METIFITGIGTGIGKTLISAIVAEALDADYWKPIQAGTEGNTDSQSVKNWLTNGNKRVHQELYLLAQPASPHIAARSQNLQISIQKICEAVPRNNRNLIIEGAGGLMVPLNDNEFVADLITALKCRVIMVSRNYLGSINHSILTATVARQKKFDVLGWMFNDQYLDYENEIVKWSQYQKLGSVPFSASLTAAFVAEQANNLKEQLTTTIC